jgi:hypothetical protein
MRTVLIWLLRIKSGWKCSFWKHSVGWGQNFNCECDGGCDAQKCQIFLIYNFSRNVMVDTVTKISVSQKCSFWERCFFFSVVLIPLASRTIHYTSCFGLAVLCGTASGFESTLSNLFLNFYDPAPRFENQQHTKIKGYNREFHALNIC